MKKLLYGLNPLFNFLMTGVLFFMMTNFIWASTMDFIIVFFIILVTINALSIVYLYPNSSWGYLFFSFVIYVLFVAVYILFKLLIGDITEDDNYILHLILGMLLSIVFIVTTTCLVIGNFLGLVISRLIKSN